MSLLHSGGGSADSSGRYGPRRDRSESRAQRRVRRRRQRLSEWLQEIQWLLPVGGGLVGFVLGLLFNTVEGVPNPESWAVTVDQARGALMGWLSILFAGFGIVLAVASLTIQNVTSRFSLRMLRIYQRDLRDRVVTSLFTMTAVYILTEQILLRSLGGDELAPPAGVAVAIALIVICGAAMLWYLVTITRWFRVDTTARRAAALSLAAARQHDRTRSEGRAIDPGTLSQPEDAPTVPAYRSGYVTDIDVDGLLDIAQLQGVDIVIDRRTGLAIGRGEQVGWISGGGADPATADQVAKSVEITDSRVLGESIGYGIIVLVDIAIMALSPAVNDPNTAVEIVDELGFLLPQLADFRLGSYVLDAEDGEHRLIVHASTFGDYVKIATKQIVLYGNQDPLVVRSLSRLANLLCALDLEESDRKVVDAFKAEMDGIATAAGIPG